jgi:hypothetical protein
VSTNGLRADLDYMDKSRFVVSFGYGLRAVLSVPPREGGSPFWVRRHVVGGIVDSAGICTNGVTRLQGWQDSERLSGLAVVGQSKEFIGYRYVLFDLLSEGCAFCSEL